MPENKSKHFPTSKLKKIDSAKYRQLQLELEQLQKHHELILHSAGEGIYGLDCQGHTTFVNKAAATMIGWELPELIGKPQHSVIHHTKPDGTVYQAKSCPIYAAFKDGKVHQEISMIEDRDSFYMATVGENGWPYVQFRGGPKGFLKIIDQETIGYADFKGNMQYISTGNNNATKKAALILLDYATKRRLKIWAETEILDPQKNTALRDKLTIEGYDAVVERLVVFHVKAFDWNCPQHINQRYTLDEFEQLIKEHPEVSRGLVMDEQTSK